MKTLLTIPNGYFQSLVFSMEGIWAANAFTVVLINKGQIVKKFDFSKFGRLLVI